MTRSPYALPLASISHVPLSPPSQNVSSLQIPSRSSLHRGFCIKLATVLNTVLSVSMKFTEKSITKDNSQQKNTHDSTQSHRPTFQHASHISRLPPLLPKLLQPQPCLRFYPPPKYCHIHGQGGHSSDECTIIHYMKRDHVVTMGRVQTSHQLGNALCQYQRSKD